MSMNPRFLLGVAVGLLLVVGLFVVIYFVAGQHKNQRKYDERQSIARLKAYRASFWILCTYAMLNSLYERFSGARWGDAIVESFIGVCLALTVFVVMCVFSDAYFALNEKRSFYLGLFGFMALANIVPAIINILERESFFEDGVLNFRVMSFIVVAMFVILFIALAIKALISRKTDRE